MAGIDEFGADLGVQRAAAEDARTFDTPAGAFVGFKYRGLHPFAPQEITCAQATHARADHCDFISGFAECVEQKIARDRTVQCQNCAGAGALAQKATAAFIESRRQYIVGGMSFADIVLLCKAKSLSQRSEEGCFHTVSERLIRGLIFSVS